MRVTSKSSTKHKKVLKMAKGYRMARSKRYRSAHEAVLHAGQYAYIGRKLRKRDKRREWITQINAALTHLAMTKGEEKLKYSQFVHALKAKNIQIDRKILAQLSIDDPETFNYIVQNATKSSSS
jgi:large subunit ribosomal protein L20